MGIFDWIYEKVKIPAYDVKNDLEGIISLLEKIEVMMEELLTLMKGQGVSEQAFKRCLDEAIARSTESTGWALLAEAEGPVTSELARV